MASKTPRTADTAEIWHWNCRSFQRRAAALQIYIDSAISKPDIICLQEIGKGTVKLRDYYTVTNQQYPRVATLVHTGIAVSAHYAPQCTTEHQIIEIHTTKKGRAKTFICNIYSPPKERRPEFADILEYALGHLEVKDKFILLGDFNAPHTNWGYRRDTPKGRSLVEITDKYDLELATLPLTPTRLGNSVCGDTYPDLTFTLNIADGQWRNLDENLGSDHYVISYSMTTPRLKRAPKQAKVTNWTAYRKYPMSTTPPNTAEDWANELKVAHKATTRNISINAKTPAVDPHLLHLWEGRRSLTKRWKNQRLNRKLRARIATVTEQANEYARQLQAENWLQFCDSLRGTLSTAKTWAILRSMIDPDSTKTATTRTIRTIVGEYKSSTDALIQALRDKYIKTGGDSVESLNYKGPTNDPLDAPVTVAELYAAAQDIRRNTAPGEDGITNAMLHNLSNDQLVRLVDYFNKDIWETGTIPQQWKEATIVLIPKLGKQKTIQNLRPISLTSCLGKLFEKVILTRLTDYIERQNLLSLYMYGFRKHLATQDVFLRLRDEVINNVATGEENIVVALDLKSAFDTMSHKLIMEELEKMGCGKKTFDYIKSFLTGRTATIGLEDIRSPKLNLPNKGTPQGAILSPLLFNIGMNNLARRLHLIQDLKFALYADDITLWMHKGSLGHKESTLQEAINTVQHFVAEYGMACAPEKSEWIRVHGRNYRNRPNLHLQLENSTLPERNKIRVLGLWIQSNRRADHTIATLKTTMKQIARLIGRITKKGRGLHESETIRLVQAFIISRITYALPYQNLNRTETKMVDQIIRGAYKAALGLPVNTSNERLHDTGVYNTFEELKAAVLINQMERLCLTEAGQQLLTELSYPVRPQYCSDRIHQIPSQIRKQIQATPIPKNMNPEYHKGRRQARAKQLIKSFGNNQDVQYTDAARTTRGHVIVAVRNTQRKRADITASIKTTCTATAEASAIAMAIKHSDSAGHSALVISDSQAACRMYMQGRLPRIALRIIGDALQEQHAIIWCPGHEGIPGNERAHSLARELTNRAGNHSPCQDSPITARDILEHQRRTRERLAPPHRQLGLQEARAYRRIQTHTYPHLGRAHHMNPTLHAGACPWCGAWPSLPHVTWECTNRPQEANSRHILTYSREPWEILLAQPELEAQRGLLDQAQRVARITGVLD